MIGDLINEVIRNLGNENVYRRVKESVKELCAKFPLYPELLQETDEKMHWVPNAQH